MNAIIPLALLESAPVSLHSSDRLDWNDPAVTLFEIRAGAYQVPATAQYRVNMRIGPPARVNCVCGDRCYSRIQVYDDADVTPADVPGMWTDDTDYRILRIAISDRFVRSIAGQIGARIDITPRLQRRDARMRHLAAALRAGLQTEDTPDALYAEGLCTALVVRLLSSSRDGVTKVADHAGTLAPRVATRMIDYIKAHLHVRLMLTELAAQAGLSVPHFNVLFRAALGVPAHRYVVQRRAAYAKALLLEGRHSVSQIILDMNFVHRSHMTQWMQWLLGVTPHDAIHVGKTLATTADTPIG